jgi:hypothetical protein
MALAHSTNFSFFHLIRPYVAAYGANDYQSSKQRHIDFKEMFKNSGWTVLATSKGNGTVYNDGSRLPGPIVEGTDSWGTNYATLNRSPSTSRVWCVLQCPPLMGTMQVVIGCDNASSGNDEMNEFDMRWSPSGSFLASSGNGGTDGTLGAYPTAPDQIFSPHGLYHSGNTENYHEMHACWADDGSQFYIFATNSYAITSFWGFAKLANAHPDLDFDGLVFVHSQLDSTLSVGNDPNQTEMDSQHWSSAVWRGVVSGTQRSFYLGGSGYASNLAQNFTLPRNDKSLTIAPCDIYLNTGGIEGFYGTVPDLYWCPVGLYQSYIGDAVDGDMNWFSGGTFMLPWDKLQPQIRTR